MFRRDPTKGEVADSSLFYESRVVWCITNQKKGALRKGLGVGHDRSRDEVDGGLFTVCGKLRVMHIS